MTLNHCLVLGALLFVFGAFGAMTRRNILGILISLELMFNGAMLNFVAFGAFSHPSPYGVPALHGQVFALFIILLAAAEAVVGLALVLAVYRNLKDIRAEQLNLLKW